MFLGVGKGGWSADIKKEVSGKLTQTFKRKIFDTNTKIPLDCIVVVPKSKGNSRGVNHPATAYWLHHYGLQ